MFMDILYILMIGFYVVLVMGILLPLKHQWRKNWTLVLLLIATVGGLFLAFDRNIGFGSPAMWSGVRSFPAFLPWLTFPFVVLGTVIVSWILFSTKHYTTAMLLYVLPPINFVFSLWQIT
jgi:hypothetical protein